MYLPPNRDQLSLIYSISMGPNSAECLKGGKGNVLYPLTYIHTYILYINILIPLPFRSGCPGIWCVRKCGVYNRKYSATENQSVFIVANIGLWYNEEEIFEKVYIDA